MDANCFCGNYGALCVKYREALDLTRGALYSVECSPLVVKNDGKYALRDSRFVTQSSPLKTISNKIHDVCLVIKCNAHVA